MTTDPVAGVGRWDDVDRDCLLLAIEQSLRVRNNAHFFSWTQGALQSLIPHDVLCCASFDAQGEQIAAEVICPMPMTSEARVSITRAEHGLLGELRELWEHGGRAPLLLDSAMLPNHAKSTIAGLLTSLGFESIAAHGAASPGGGADCFFSFARIGKPLDARLAQALEIVMPHLRAALIRTKPRKRQADPIRRKRNLTPREAEIHRLLQQGHSNAEIGITLSISPLTVKNHVQKVLRKLGVRNRTQAAAFDIGLNRAP